MVKVATCFVTSTAMEAQLGPLWIKIFWPRHYNWWHWLSVGWDKDWNK